MARHLWVAGVDRWRDYERGTTQIEQVLTYQTDTARFQVRGEKPSDGDEVIVEDDSIGRLFAGIVVKVDLANTLPDRSVNVWQVEADDFCVLLDRRLVVETYQNMPADAIFRDIAAKYCPGFTVNGVRSGAPTVELIAFDYLPPSECFKQLCDYVGWQWYVDYFKDLKFFSVDDLAMPAPMKLTPGGYFRGLKHTIDQTGLRNRVYVCGGTMLSDPWTYEVKADGSARAWVLPHKPHDISVAVGGVAKTCGIENVDDESTKDFLMNFEEKYVRASAQTPTPAAGTTISFTYRYDIDVITMVEDTESQQAIAAIQGGDGVYEHVIVDDSLTITEAAEAAGWADLREHANPTVKGSFDTEISGWTPGQLVEIDLPDRRVQGTFLVQKVTITPATPDKWTWHVEYGGRLKGIADVLKALVSAQQKKKLNDTNILHKVNVLPDSATITDEIISTPRTPGWVVESLKVDTDNFDRTSIGSNWVEQNPAFPRWSIENGRLKSQATGSNGYNSLWYVNRVIGNELIVIIEYDVFFTGSGPLWGGFDYRGVGVDVNPSRCGIRNNIPSEQWFAPGISKDVWHHIKAVITTRLNTLELYVDGQMIVTDIFRSSSDPIYTSNVIGLRSTYYTNDGGYALYDNFKISSTKVPFEETDTVCGFVVCA